MTWLSRLLPQSPSLQRLADHNRTHRARQGKRRRRMANLERLEDRTLLSNITVSQDPSTDVVTILGDTHGDALKVTVNPDNTISVVGTGSPVKTQVNNHAVGVAYTSPVAALGLSISLPGNGNVSDVVALQGQGQTVLTELKSISVTVTGTEPLNFTANGIRTASGPGTFTLTDGTATVAGGQLSAYVTNSQFSALTIFQTGCCPAYVELDNDIVPGAVSVTEGVANGDSIVLDNPPVNGAPGPGDHFGATSLVQNAGPTMTGCNGDGDQIHVDDVPFLLNLSMSQGDGAGDLIEVGLNSEVEVSVTSFGILAAQGNGSCRYDSDRLDHDLWQTDQQPAPGPGQHHHDSGRWQR